ncbi:MAG TPA: VanZ family protein, partial [Pirellulaceae bacterium]|nr:VanZ family protein [Pirellulaceae bacterium]
IDMPQSDSQTSFWPQPRHLAAVACAWSLFVVYGSLTPFQFQPLDWREVPRIVQWMLEQPLAPASRGDWVTNVLLLVPFGGALLGAYLIDRDRPLRRAAGIGLVLVLGLVLSSGVEFAQIWFPPRYPSKSDVLAQTLGNVLGMGLWILAGQRVIDWVRRELAGGRAGRAAVLLQMYAAGLLLFSLLPLDLTIRLGELWGKYKAGQIVLVPFAHWNWNLAHFMGVVLDAAALWPIGMLAALWPDPSHGRRHGIAVRSLAAIAFVGLIEFLQLFVRSRFSDVTDLIVGTLGVSGGLWVALLWRSCRGPSTRSRLWIPAGCWIAVGLLVVAAYLTPFELESDPGLARERLAAMFRVPLEILRHGEPLAMVLNVLKKLIWFGVLGWLTGETASAFAGAERRSWPLVAGGAIAGLLLAATIEVLQAWFPPHVPDVTDILWGAVGGGLGAYVGRCLSDERAANLSS